MLALVDQIRSSTQLRWNRVHRFNAKIELNIEVGPYILRTAQNSKELIEAFKLRHQVFHQEFQECEKPGLDFDRYDYHFDHLIVNYKLTNSIIGTYRLNCSNFSKESYTALEFDMPLMHNEGAYLELGRACIHKDFRKGAVISLLWRGIAEYMNQSGAEFLFGCSSLKINNAREAALVFKYLKDEGFVTHDFKSKPTKKFSMRDFDSWYSYFRAGLSEAQITEAQALVPPLVKSYLKLGAKIACEPAFDEEFDCIDLLTILRKEDLSNSLAEKFKVAR